MRKIRKGDLIEVLAGKDKGQQGKVLRVVDEGRRVVVEGLNLHRHHVKRDQRNPEGGIISREAPLDISNVGFVSPSTGKPVRVGFTWLTDAAGEKRKVRTVHKTGEILDPA
jgi:large subunit ribosomal protein L24